MKKVITTVGTSVFTNILREEFKHEKKEGIKEICNYRLKDKPFIKWNELYNNDPDDNDIEDLKKGVMAIWSEEKNNNDSAEIESLLAIKKELKEEKIEVYLLATDTVLSVLACLLIRDWFEGEDQFIFPQFLSEKGENIEDLTEDKIKEMLVIENLRIVSDSSSEDSDNKIDDDTINSGFLNLIGKIKTISNKNKKKDVILNISGGYKAFIPILTIMGQLYNIPLKYIYEGSDRLVSIDQFPINFDWEIVDLFMPYLDNPSSIPQELTEKLQKLHLIEQKNGGYVCSSMGDLLKQFFDAEMPTSKKVIGYFVEYKLYEYFHKCCGSVYSNIERSVSISIGNSNAEIDLQLTSQNEEILACEVKTFSQVKNYFSNISKAAKKRISIYKNKGNILKGYILIFYKLKGQSIDESILENLRSMKSSLKSELEVVFKACYLDLPLTNDNDGTNYIKLVQHALKEEDLKEIDLIKNTPSIVESTCKP